MGTLAQLPEDLKFTVGELITAERLNEIAEYYNGTTYYDSGIQDEDSFMFYARGGDEDRNLVHFYGEWRGITSSGAVTSYCDFYGYLYRWQWDDESGKWKWVVSVERYNGLSLFSKEDSYLVLHAGDEGWFHAMYYLDYETLGAIDPQASMQIYGCFPTNNVRGDYLVYMDDIDSSGNRTSIGEPLTAEMLNTGRCMTIPYI